MISWIVASHNPAILYDNLLPSLDLADGADELVVVEDPPSIAVAYNEGAARATRPVRCYIHHDVQILDAARLRADLVEHCTVDVGIVGVVGSRDVALPWWEGACCGSVEDGRLGLIDFSPGGQPCSYLDGLLLATAQDVVWDETYGGFHLYDHDVCQQMLDRGLSNWCLAAGHTLVRHNTRGAFRGWGGAMDRFHEKWGVRQP